MSAFLRYFVNYVSVMKDMRRNNHNVERARAVFAAYDAAKDQAMGEVIAGYPLHLVAVS